MTIVLLCLPVPGFSQYSGADRQRCEAEAREVTITRDKWGIPHIYGKTDAEAVFGLMYAECQEDFSRVEKNYLEMLGRQAEAYGESYLYNDVMMRLIYDSAAAIADYQRSPPWMHKLLDAFADGVNYYLYRHPGTKPLLLTHFEPWYPLMFTDGSVSATSTGGARVDEVQRFYGGNVGGAGVPVRRRSSLTDVERMILMDRGIGPPGDGLGEMGDAGCGGDAGGLNESWLPDDAEKGSNGFALSGFRTASGNTELYINPHVPFYFRLEVQLTSDEGLNTYGAVTWGQFFVYQGFNAHCGWMHTSSLADVADLYAEKVQRQGDRWVYAYAGETRPVKAKPFTVYYKRNDSVLAMPVTGFYTHHGPVLASREGKWLSVRENNRSLNALLEAWLITKANTFDDYKKAMDLRANTTNNTVYADDQGNIAYWHGNFMPRRDTSFDWSLPVDGSIAATEWNGLHELDEIVHCYNPATGWIQNCNSTPFSSSGGSSPLRDRFPAYMAPDGENFRALNAVRLLAGANDFTLDSLTAKGYDRYLMAFDVMLPALFDAYVGSPDTTRRNLQEAISLLQKWDRRSAVHSVATTLAVEWGTRILRFAPRPATAEAGSNAVAVVQSALEHSTPAQKTGELTAVLAELRQRYGSWKIEWGDICRYQRLTGKIAESYDDRKPSLPAGLVASTFGALPSYVSRVMPGTSKRYGVSGNSFIAAVEFGKRVKARTIVTGGESSDPASPNFTDQAAMYLGGKFKDVLFYPEEVQAGAVKRYHPGEE
ncbi:MAG TPA: penicillin acylase family protein [Puia sp.]|nr:penicillin acylase family protein [Puia sp.]